MSSLKDLQPLFKVQLKPKISCHRKNKILQNTIKESNICKRMVQLPLFALVEHSLNCKMNNKNCYFLLVSVSKLFM